MEDLREIIAKNICELRTASGYTQSKLAELLNYTDKAVSKWERAESVPDIAVLKQIADLFGVSVDYLLESEHRMQQDSAVEITAAVRRNRGIVTALAAMLVWLVATFIFVQMKIMAPQAALRPWMMFIYAIPVSCVVLLVFNSIWGKKKLNYLIISVIVWSLLLSVYLTFLTATGHNLWLQFFLGIPAQIIILLWSGLRSTRAYK